MTVVATDDSGPEPVGRRARNRLRRERAYLDAALEIVTQEGMENLTMQGLASKVQAAVGTVYTYYPSKGALVAELQREAVERLNGAYRHTRERSEALLADWTDPKAVAVARMEVFAAVWLAAPETMPQEVSLLLTLFAAPGEALPPEEYVRVLPATLQLLGDGQREIEAATEAGAIDQDDSLRRSVRWAAAISGALLLSSVPALAIVVADTDGESFAAAVHRDIVRGWGVDRQHLAAAEDHVAALAAEGPLAPLLP